MRKILTALLASATISATAIATSSNANAWWGWWFPGAVAAGVVTGAVVGSTLAPRPYYYRMVTTLTTRTLITDPGAARSGMVTTGYPLASYELGGGR
jgi:uncharacterized membrane protein YgcG